MKLPEHTQQLIDHYLEEVKLAPQRSLKPSHRFEIYKTFGPSNFTKETWYRGENGRLVRNPDFVASRADQLVSWLAVITAKKVLCIWERVKEQVEANPDLLTTPQEIIETCEKLLLNSIDIDSACDSYGDYNTGLGIQHIVTFDVANSYKAAYRALELIIFGPKYVNPNFRTNNGEVYDSEADFAERALAAYISIDPNAPGDYWDAGISSISFDHLKRLEFWQWWLTEAIPQAWELANQSAT